MIKINFLSCDPRRPRRMGEYEMHNNAIDNDYHLD